MEVSKTKLLMNNYLYLIDSIIFHVGCAIGFFEIDFTNRISKKEIQSTEKFFCRLKLYEEKFWNSIDNSNYDITLFEILITNLSKRRSELEELIKTLQEKYSQNRISNNIIPKLIETSTNLSSFIDKINNCPFDSKY